MSDVGKPGQSDDKYATGTNQHNTREPGIDGMILQQ